MPKIPHLIALSSTLVLLPLAAVPVDRGQTAALSGSTYAATPEYGGVSVISTTIPFEIRNTLNEIVLTGDYNSFVTRSTLTGRLNFGGRISNLVQTGGPVWIDGVNLSGYGFVDVDVDYRLDGLGNIGPNRVTRSASGDELFLSHGSNIIVPPDSSRFYAIITQADEYVSTGDVTINASNDFGGSFFSTTITGAHIPVKPPTNVWIDGEIFFFETQYWLTLKIDGAAAGLKLSTESSTTLKPGSWSDTGENSVTSAHGVNTLFVPVETGTVPRNFFRIKCALPADG